ncbi:hypothetical protein Tco_1301267 [Tanacetum coccineum]
MQSMEDTLIACRDLEAAFEYPVTHGHLSSYYMLCAACCMMLHCSSPTLWMFTLVFRLGGVLRQIGIRAFGYREAMFLSVRSFVGELFFLIELSVIVDPKEEPFEMEPLMELKEIVVLIGALSLRGVVLEIFESGYHQLGECMKKIFQRLPLGCGMDVLSLRLRGLNQLMERKEGGGADKTYYDLRDMYGGHVWRRILLPISWWKIYFEALVDIAEGIENTAKTCVRLIILKWIDKVHLEEIKVDKTFRFVEEPVGIIDHEVKSLKRSRIPIVKSIGTRSKVMRIS